MTPRANVTQIDTGDGMVGRRSAQGAGVFGSFEEWLAQRNAELERLRGDAEAVGRSVWDQATRTGQAIAAKRPSDVLRLGSAALAARRQPSAAPNPVRTGGGTRTAPRDAHAKTWRDQAVDEVLAGARGVQDALTLGAGDHLYAGVRAAGDALQGQDIRQAYATRMAAERARDARDAKEHPIARASGQILGTGIGFAALGPVDGLLAGGVRMAEATPLALREIGVLGGVGAGGGVVGQGVQDFERKRFGTVGDYVGAALGGGTAALASARVGPGQANAMGGAVTSVAQDVLDGRHVSLSKAADSSLAGGYFGAPFGLAGRAYSEALKPWEKGKLGETLGRIRTMANFDIPEAGGRRVELPSGRVTVLDQEANLQPISEQKFGRSARLSKAQREAYELFGPDDYRIDHFLPRDIGALYGFPTGQLGYHQFLEGSDP